MRSKLLRWYLHDGGILHRPGVFLSPYRAFLPSPCGTWLLHCHSWGAATSCHVNFKCNQVNHRNEEYFIPGTIPNRPPYYISLHNCSHLSLCGLQPSLMHIIHHTIMRVTRLIFFQAPLPSNSVALSIHFLPALVRIPWIVFFSVVASFSTYSTTAMVPVSCHPIIDHDMRGVVCYCTAFFTYSLISFARYYSPVLCTSLSFYTTTST